MRDALFAPNLYLHYVPINYQAIIHMVNTNIVHITDTNTAVEAPAIKCELVGTENKLLTFVILPGFKSYMTGLLCD